jgi:hypothetical protein
MIPTLRTWHAYVSRLSIVPRPPQHLRPRFRTLANLGRPAPLPLPRDEQREFEHLQRTAQFAPAPPQADAASAALNLHPDARQPLKPEFNGDTNPITGEQGGPKKEPVGRWGDNSEGDWSFKGRVSDF